MRLSFNNKKGDIPSLILAVVLIFVVGILLIFFARLRDPLYTALDQYFNDTEDTLNATVAQEALVKIAAVEQTVWDFAFLAIMFGIVIALVATAFATRIHVAFFWIYIVTAMVVILLSVMLGNAWETLANDPSFATTIAQYPITNTVLGSNFTPFVAIFIFVFIMVLFGKTPGGQGGFR